MLRQAPTFVLGAVHQVLSDFKMPGTVIPNFSRRAVAIARAGIYNLRIHAEQVVQPLLRHWKVGSIEGLDSQGEELQEKILAIPEALIAQAEAFENRMAGRTRRVPTGA